MICSNIFLEQRSMNMVSSFDQAVHMTVSTTCSGLCPWFILQHLYLALQTAPLVSKTGTSYHWNLQCLGLGRGCALPCLGRTLLVWARHIALALAGMELIFLTAARMVLWFPFLTKPVLVTQQCLSHCWTVLAWHQSFSVSPSVTSGNKLGVGKRLEGDTARTAGLNWPKR